jgi:hypothetical protein
MLGSRTMTNYSRMTAVEDAGERLRLSIVLDVKAPTERYNITERSARGSGQAEIGRG